LSASICTEAAKTRQKLEARSGRQTSKTIVDDFRFAPGVPLKRNKDPKVLVFTSIFGVTDGARTHDNQNHNLNKIAFAYLDAPRYNPCKSRTYDGSTFFDLDVNMPNFGK
jgi:hypothetical protein